MCANSTWLAAVFQPTWIACHEFYQNILW